MWGYLGSQRHKWIASYYYVFTTITTVGYGDLGSALATAMPQLTACLFDAGYPDNIMYG